MKDRSTYTDGIVLDELLTRVLCDTGPRAKVADAAYLFGETRDNETSVLAAGEYLWRLGRVRHLCIINQKRGHGFPGFESWKRKLVKRGIPPTIVLAVPLTTEFPPSTHAEAASLIRFATLHRWRRLFIVAPPLHQLRAFVSCVSVQKDKRAAVKFYNFVGFPQRWKKHIIHSQGVQKGTRSHLLRKELLKIQGYLEHNDLVSPHDVLKYMDRRDV